MIKNIKKYKYIITIVIFILIVVCSGILKTKLKNDNKQVSKEEFSIKEDTPKKEDSIKLISVDIKGAIKNTGVYQIEDSKRVIDVINLAGGLNENADTTLINLSKKLTDEMVIIIYTKKEVEEAKLSGVAKTIDGKCTYPNIKNDSCISVNSKTSDTSTINGPISINTATLEELQSLTGVGQSKAEAIIKYREENGEFKSIEDIKNVSGIGDSVYEKIKDNITT